MTEVRRRRLLAAGVARAGAVLRPAQQIVATRADPPPSAAAISFTATFDSAHRTTVTSPDRQTIALDGVSGSTEGVSR